MELQNSFLTVTIDEPGSRYTGTRFDWTSQVSGVRAADGTAYLGQEAPPGAFVADKGIGLASEFGIRSAIGYDDCPIGDWFPKIGVGWIQREGPEDYNFFHMYRNLETAPWTVVRQVASDGESLVLSMDGGLRRGYGWQLTRTWTLRGRQLSCSLALLNSGTKSFSTNEYCHNFVAPGSGGGERRLALSWGKPLDPAKLVSPDHNLAMDQDGVAINLAGSGEYYASNLGLALPAGSSWELRHHGRPWVKEELSCPGTHCDLWGKSSVISAELFAAIELVPGASQSWQRSWTFGV